MKPAPLHCRPAAFAHFAAQLPHLDAHEALLEAAIAISMHELDQVDPRQTAQRVFELAARARRRVRLSRIFDWFEEEDL